MKRLIAGLAVLVLAALASACGQASTVSGPSVDVAWEQGAGADGFYSAALTPADGPSGVIALKVVHGGTVKTVARYRFSALQSSGSLQVQASGRSITATWKLPGGAGPKVARLAIPERMRGSDSSWSGGTVSRGDGLGEQTIWEQERALGHPPSGSSSMTIGSFEALVRDSAQYSQRTAYCLTLTVEAR